ncbi:MAG TPA: thioredoxin-dependent thiol peroxidase [Acholeplasmataceae bacterium]|jgi:peroxiredoxin Q/BCP|nr:thioredoxin-dependent thiol peroxidase [Acholeplasmataceae bacterium]
MLKVGQIAPEFTLNDQFGNQISLSSFKGKKVVIYFYPKDHTPGCTRQACAFRDAFTGFKEKDIVVIGISKDSIDSHRKFVDDYELPFILLSDPDLEVIKAYEVWVEKTNFGKKSFGVSRSTYVLDEEGRIIKVFKKANPDTNAEEILKLL